MEKIAVSRNLKSCIASGLLCLGKKKVYNLCKRWRLGSPPTSSHLANKQVCLLLLQPHPLPVAIPNLW